ncbi:MAG: Hsp20/alpha crystallin family protein [Thermodesulfobacteriota bacterium]
MPFFKDEAMKDLTSLQERMNKLFTESLKRIKEFAEPEGEKPWSPPVDIYELPDSFVIVADLPGVTRGAVAVEVQGATLTIRGDRTRGTEAEGGTMHRSERRYGSFERSFNLPVNVESELIKARMNDGVLVVTIDKPAGDSSKIHVNVE